MEKHDAVFIIGTQSYMNKNFEIKVAINALKRYCGSWLGKIYVIGAKPPTEVLNEVVWVHAEDYYKPKTHIKDANIIHKLKIACGIDGLSEDFLFCSDDQFVVKESSWEDFRPRYVKPYKGNESWFSVEATKGSWKRNMVGTLKRFGDKGKYFEPHIWSPINKTKFLNMCKDIDYLHDNNIIIFTLYYNYIGEEGVPLFDKYHCSGSRYNWGDERHIGYCDTSLRHKGFIDKLCRLFDVEY